MRRSVRCCRTRTLPGVSRGVAALRPRRVPWRWYRCQFAEGLSDRQAVDQVRARMDWKFLLGLELDDPGFDYTILGDFRSRLIRQGLEELVLEVVLARLSGAGRLHAGRQRAGSTHVLAAVRTLNRMEFVGETLRAALEALAAAAPGWLSGRSP